MITFYNNTKVIKKVKSSKGFTTFLESMYGNNTSKLKFKQLFSGDFVTIWLNDKKLPIYFSGLTLSK